MEDIGILPNMKIQSKLGSDVNLRQEKSLDSKVLKVLKNGLEFIGTREDGWVKFEWVCFWRISNRNIKIDKGFSPLSFFDYSGGLIGGFLQFHRFVGNKRFLIQKF